jgi:hypothetical protein
VSPVRYELGFYIPEDDILHSHRRESLKSYMAFVPVEDGGTQPLQRLPGMSKRRAFKNYWGSGL